MEKKQIRLYSNPTEVYRRAKKIYWEDGKDRTFYEERKKIYDYHTRW